MSRSTPRWEKHERPDTDVNRGLAGVVADSSAISVVDEETGSLLYRGYPVPDLAASCSFEEVAYLIWYGELPSASQLSPCRLRSAPGGSCRRNFPSFLGVVPDLPPDGRAAHSRQLPGRAGPY